MIFNILINKVSVSVWVELRVTHSDPNKQATDPLITRFWEETWFKSALRVISQYTESFRVALPLNSGMQISQDDLQERISPKGTFSLTKRYSYFTSSYELRMNLLLVPDTTS